MAKHSLDYDLLEEVKLVYTFVSPNPFFHPYETKMTFITLFLNLSLVPLVRSFTMNLLRKRTFAPMDPPDASTLENEEKNSTNEHENFKVPQDSCSIESVSLCTTCFH